VRGLRFVPWVPWRLCVCFFLLSAESWGVSYGMNVASEWKDVLMESVKGAIILAILERLYVTRSASWFEDHIGASDRARCHLACYGQPD